MTDSWKQQLLEGDFPYSWMAFLLDHLHPDSPHARFTRVKSLLRPLGKSSWVVLDHFSCTGTSSEEGGLSLPSEELPECFNSP